MGKVFETVSEEQFKDRAMGGLVAAACLDALGNVNQFGPRIPHEDWVRDMKPARWSNTPAGTYTDDTSMSLCVAQAYLDKGAFDPRHTMDVLLDWYRDGRLSAVKGRAFDVGIATSRALSDYARTGSLTNGCETTRGNGSLLRAFPAWLIGLAEGNVPAVTMSVSDMTHNSAFVRDYVKTLNDIFQTHVFTGQTTTIYRAELLSTYTTANFPNGGFVKDTLEGALWCYYTSHFEEAAIKACNAGGDSDSVGAVLGAIAGSRFGMGVIPPRWIDGLQDHDAIISLYSDFVTAIIAKIREREG